MPLSKECSQEAFDRNVRTLANEGKPRNQAVAIAFSVLRDSCGVPKGAHGKMSVKDILAYGKKREARMLFSRLFDDLDRTTELDVAAALTQEQFEALLSGLDEGIADRIRKAVGSKAILLALLAAIGGAVSTDIRLAKPLGGKDRAVAALQIGNQEYVLQVQKK